MVNKMLKHYRNLNLVKSDRSPWWIVISILIAMTTCYYRGESLYYKVTLVYFRERHHFKTPLLL